MVYTLGLQRGCFDTRGLWRDGLGFHTWASEGLFWRTGLWQGRNLFTHLGSELELVAGMVLGSVVVPSTSRNPLIGPHTSS